MLSMLFGAGPDGAIGPGDLVHELDVAGVPSGPFRDALIDAATDDDRLFRVPVAAALAAAIREPQPAGMMAAFVRFGDGVATGPSWKGRVFQPHPLVRASARHIFREDPVGLLQCFKPHEQIETLVSLYGQDVFTSDAFFRQLSWPSNDFYMRLLAGCVKHDADMNGQSPSQLRLLPTTHDFVLAMHRASARRSASDAEKCRNGWKRALEEWIRDSLGQNQKHAAVDGHHVIASLQSALFEQEVRIAALNDNEPLPPDWVNAPFLQGLTEDRVRLLVRRSIEEDVRYWRRSQGPGELFAAGMFASRWYASPYRGLWRSAMRAYVQSDQTSLRDRFDVLRHCIPPGGSFRLTDNDHLPSVLEHMRDEVVPTPGGGRQLEFTIDREDADWWNIAYKQLTDQPEFDRDWLPQWLEGARGRFDRQDLVRPANDCMGLLRKLLKEESHCSLRDFRTAIDILHDHDRPKLVRSVLLALRSCSKPSTGSDLATPAANNSSEPFVEGLAAEQALMCLITRMFVVGYVGRMRDEVLWEICNHLAEFCICRLQLKRREKADAGGYTTDQCTEPDPNWRQAYLMAMKELGMDVEGRAHKTAFFVRKNDPDPQTRKVAEQAYKAVRRAKPSDLVSLRRGAIAAIWWFRLAQRHSLGKEVDSAGARLTRRRELRDVR